MNATPSTAMRPERAHILSSPTVCTCVTLNPAGGISRRRFASTARWANSCHKGGWPHTTAFRHRLVVPGRQQLWSPPRALHELGNVAGKAAVDLAQHKDLLDSVADADFWQTIQPRLGTIQLMHFLQELQASLAGHVPDLDNTSFPAMDDSAHLQHLVDSTTAAASHAADAVSSSVHELGQLGHAVADTAASLAPESAALGAVAGAAATDLHIPLASIQTPGLLNGVGSWAAHRLSTIQHIDPEGFTELRSSLAGLLDSVVEVVNTEATVQTQHAYAALTLGLQQLVSLDRPGAATFENIGAMTASQSMFTSAAETSGLGADTLGKITAAIVALTVASVPPKNSAKMQDEDATDVLPLRYDPEGLAKYWSRRPLKMMRRNMVVTSKLTTFFTGLLMDWKMGRFEANMPRRAAQVRQMVEELGPAFIKVAQMLSTRVDVMPEPYILELQTLQDRVPPFCNEEAFRVMEEGLGRPVATLFDYLTEKPVASASLGQVYRGRLKAAYGGGEVAVKVQRPHVLEAASLDIHIIRRMCKLFSQLPNAHNDMADVLDDWAVRFFQEMDYQAEAYNMMTFKAQMRALQGITVADVYPDLTSRRVLISEWCAGERLNNANPKEIRALCSTVLNCYLIQLLETGFLHADPHPGNLLHTPDGRICILDFGLMTEVTEAQRIALVEFIAHLITEDWEAVCSDLVTLGFVPPGQISPVEAGLVPLMVEIMGKVVKGGGARHLSVAGILAEVEGVSKDYRMIIPPYFALILRAFSTIEGIALKVDPDYAIVQECLPYLSRRLLTDNNPRMREALRQVLYGDKKRLDIDRLQKLISAFGNFTTSAAHHDGDDTSASAASGSFDFVLNERVKGRPSRGYTADKPMLNDATKEALKVIFSKDGTYAQELVVDELVAAVDALSREAVGEAFHMVLSSATTIATLQSVEALGPLRAMFMPVPMPVDMLHNMAPSISLTDDDRMALTTIQSILDMLAPSIGHVPGAAAAGRRVMRTAGELVPLLPELLPGVRHMMELFLRQLLRRMALRLAEDLQPATTGGTPLSTPLAAAAAGAAAATQPAWSPEGYQMPASQVPMPASAPTSYGGPVAYKSFL